MTSPGTTLVSTPLPTTAAITVYLNHGSEFYFIEAEDGYSADELGQTLARLERDGFVPLEEEDEPAELVPGGVRIYMGRKGSVWSS